MLERFLTLRKCISKALIDSGKSISVSEREIEAFSSVVSSLHPIKLAVERLSHRDATLLPAEGVFTFILNELNALETSFSNELIQSVQKRFQQRRDKNLIGLLMYLNSY